MAESTLPSGTGPSVGTPSRLQQELTEHNRLLQAQSKMVQRFLESQGAQLAEAMVQRGPQARFTMPDEVVISPETGATARVPSAVREESIGGFVDRVTRNDVRVLVRQRLAELEQATDPAVSASARLMRHATVMHMIHRMLPAGRSVNYRTPEGEAIPHVPLVSETEVASAITATTDAIAEEGQTDQGRGELLVPYVPYARRFYLPQWVAFDEHDNLVVGSHTEAEADIASMQRFLFVLHAAVSLAPYMVADEDYQRKRYGILGQLVNQGRALARFETRGIIHTIQRRAAASDLNRGLSLSLPYFDDQTLEMKTRDFEVIPGGRIMFVPAFVVRAARDEAVKVAQDTRLDPGTRRHLLDELAVLERAFLPPEDPGKSTPANQD
jgi:hypothetical protein